MCVNKISANMTEEKRAIHLFFGQKILFSNNNIYLKKTWAMKVKNMLCKSISNYFANTTGQIYNPWDLKQNSLWWSLFRGLHTYFFRVRSVGNFVNPTIIWILVCLYINILQTLLYLEVSSRMLYNNNSNNYTITHTIFF